MPCVVPDPDEPLNWGWVGEEPAYDMENNNWWSGAMDGTGNNINGGKVEGAVASALYDMMDENNDPEDETEGNMSQTNDDVFNRIFKIFVDINPKTVCEFRDEWKRIYGEEDSIITKFRGILYGHRISWEGDLVEQHEGQALPNVYSLSQNYPNPFNPQTEVRFQLPEKCTVEFKIFNISGGLVMTIAEGQMAPGYYKVSWDGRNEENQQVASGIYFYRLTTENFNQTRKMALIR